LSVGNGIPVRTFNLVALLSYGIANTLITVVVSDDASTSGVEASSNIIARGNIAPAQRRRAFQSSDLTSINSGTTVDEVANVRSSAGNIRGIASLSSNSRSISVIAEVIGAEIIIIAQRSTNISIVAAPASNGIAIRYSGSARRNRVTWLRQSGRHASSSSQLTFFRGANSARTVHGIQLASVTGSSGNASSRRAKISSIANIAGIGDASAVNASDRIASISLVRTMGNKTAVSSRRNARIICARIAIIANRRIC